MGAGSSSGGAAGAGRTGTGPPTIGVGLGTAIFGKDFAAFGAGGSPAMVVLDDEDDPAFAAAIRAWSVVVGVGDLQEICR